MIHWKASSRQLRFRKFFQGRQHGAVYQASQHCLAIFVVGLDLIGHGPHSSAMPNTDGNLLGPD